MFNSKKREIERLNRELEAATSSEARLRDSNRRMGGDILALRELIEDLKHETRDLKLSPEERTRAQAELDEAMIVVSRYDNGRR